MAKLGPKGQDECRRHEAFEVARGWGPPRPPEAGECLVLICSLLGLYAALFHPAVECILNLQGLFKSEVPVVIFLHFLQNKIKVLACSFVYGIAANKGLLVHGFSWLVAYPFIFNVLLGQNDLALGHIPRTSSPPSYRPTKINSP